MSSFNDKVPGQEVASPMTNLANSLGSTLTVRRRLTLSESNETPKKGYNNVLHGKFKYFFIILNHIIHINASLIVFIFCKNINF